MIGNAAIVLKCLRAIGLLVQACHRNVTDLQQFRSGEKRHVGGVVVERVDDAALFQNHRAHAAAFQLNSAGKPGGSGADHDGVERGLTRHSLLSTSAATAASALGSALGSFPPPSAMSGL